MFFKVVDRKYEARKSQYFTVHLKYFQYFRVHLASYGSL